MNSSQPSIAEKNTIQTFKHNECQPSTEIEDVPIRDMEELSHLDDMLCMINTDRTRDKQSKCEISTQSCM